jgi:hypothetical protein
VSDTNVLIVGAVNLWSVVRISVSDTSVLIANILDMSIFWGSSGRPRKRSGAQGGATLGHLFATLVLEIAPSSLYFYLFNLFA